VLPERGSALATSIRSERLIAPELWLIEAANAVWKRQQRGEMSIGQAEMCLAELMSAPVTSLPAESYIASALQLGAALRHPIYDCLYLAVAIQHQAYVVTADRRFAAIGDRPEMSGRVRLLGS
jgi:predicted nucleic acid-binding protein